MAGIVNFKVYLEEDEESFRQEVRRFGIDSDVVMNFEYFRGKLQIICPYLKGKQFIIHWKDSDGDMITISSDEELVLALNETSTEPIRKIYIKILDDHQPNVKFCPSALPATLHEGVTCDGCNGLIRGFRFKCVQCADYDLCSSCQSQGLHPDHCMLRLVNPLYARAHFGRRFRRHMNKFAKKNSQSCYDDDDDDDDEAKVTNKSRGYKCEGKKLEKFYRRLSDYLITSDYRNGMRFMSEHLNELIPMLTEPLNEITKTENQMKNQTQDQNKNQTKGQSASKLKDNQEKYSNSQQIPKFEIPFLHQHNELMRLFQSWFLLDPVGLDVNMQMKTDYQEPTTSNNNKEKVNSNSNVNNKDECSTPSTSKSSSGTATPKTSNERNDTDKENGVSLSSEEKMNEPNTSKKNVEYVLEKDGHSDPEWTVIKEVTSKTKEQPKNSSASLYPQLPGEKIHHPNPKIQKAVELMIQMGFSNDNRQLTNLLVAKNGDIVSVIDILQQQ